MMKNMVIIAMALVLPITLALGQDIQFGAKAGINLATIQPDLNDPATRTSFHLGGMVEISVSDKFSVQPELLYSSQGATDESDDDEVIKLDYISLPILAKYFVVENLSLEAGPQLGYVVSAEVEDDGDTIDLKDDTKSTDIGFALGAGYKLENGLNFGLRYFFGSDVNDIDEDADQFKNRVFQLSIGYFF